MPLYKTQAVILKSQRWGEADRIVTCYTEHVGKVRGIARGARRMKSRFGSALEPFRLIGLTLFEKNTETLARVSQADIIEPFSKLSENLSLMTAAARMVNFIQGITPDRDPNQSTFHGLINGLTFLSDGHDPGLCTLLFHIHILGHSGFRPQLDHCADCGKMFHAATIVRFSPQAGGAVCTICQDKYHGRGLSLSPGSLAFIQQAKRLPFSKVIRLRADGRVREEVEQAIEAYVEHILGRTLPRMSLYSSVSHS
ncbi:MAG: DNA repair protein RecO [Nitrospirales bacterium]|nr:DNA repair protein RecO [Nitrospira sp.]MDR4502612.1 DNA repair protein RecO [Nitrospirales bacterium]